MHGRIAPPEQQTYGRGLENLVAGSTGISSIDGEEGKLYYRGFDVEKLAKVCSFEEVSYLLLYGKKPSSREFDRWSRDLRAWRNPPDEALRALEYLPVSSHPLAQFRTMMAAAACYVREPLRFSGRSENGRVAPVLSWTSTLAAAAIRHLMGHKPVAPDSKMGFSEHFLYLLSGVRPAVETARAFDVSLIVQAEHGLHAAALAALIIYSTGADLGSAVLAGMGALSGELHGGANQLALEMFLQFRSAKEARNWVKKKLNEKYRFPGFGHRVYKSPDPRVRMLLPWAERLLIESGNEVLWEVFCAVKEEVEGALGERGIFANVDSVTGLIYYPLGLPVSAMPIPFCLAIQCGWMAHCLEYGEEGRMIEPGAVYLRQNERKR